MFIVAILCALLKVIAVEMAKMVVEEIKKEEEDDDDDFEERLDAE